MDKKKLYETIMQNVSKQVKKSLNEDEEFETNPTITEEDGEVYLDLTLYVDKNGQFNVWIQDHEGGSGLEALGNTPEEAADNAASYICDYFYKRDEDDEDYDEDYDDDEYKE